MIRGEDHTGITFQSEDFAEADLSESSFERCSFRGTLLGRSRMVSVRLDRSELFEVDAANCLFTESKFAGTTAVDCRLLGADFSTSSYSSFRFSRFSDVIFEECDLTEADFQGCKAVGIQFDRCQMQGSQFTQARFESGKLRECDAVSIRGVDALRGLTIDFPTLQSLAPALANHCGIKLDY
jgi:uncharacterized protein YjbI with pentapeptide repeats